MNDFIIGMSIGFLTAIVGHSRKWTFFKTLLIGQVVNIIIFVIIIAVKKKLGSLS